MVILTIVIKNQKIMIFSDILSKGREIARSVFPNGPDELNKESV